MHQQKIYNRKLIRLYGADPRETPLYSISQAAQFLKIPTRTLRDWTLGRPYVVGPGQEQRKSSPIITLPQDDPPSLSFMNLIEAHVMKGIRRIEKVPFHKVRKALEYIERQFPSKYPLADNQFQTDGIDLFVEKLGQLVVVSQGGQLSFKEVMRAYLRRIDRDLDLKPLRLYPFLKPISLADEPRHISIDPLISFGRPTLVGTGIPTDVIAGRFYAGDSLAQLATDYGVTEKKVEAALRYEAPTRQAA
jgi:uncharacterized protein (DUF433 family)